MHSTPLLAALFLTLATLPCPAGDFTDAIQKAIEGAQAPPASQEGDRLYAAKKFDEAAEAYLAHVGRRPEDSNAWYNLACCLSLGGHRTDAVRALEQAVEAGFSDVEHLKGDTDLDPVRGRKAYKALVAKMEENAAADGRGANGTTWVEGRALLPCLVRVPETTPEARSFGLLLLLHGRGDQADRFLEGLSDWGGEEFIVASLETPYVMGAFGGRVARGWSPWESGKENTRRGYELSAANVARAIKALKGAYAIDAKRVYLAGFSEGAFVAAHAGLEHAGVVTGYVCIGGGMDPALTEHSDWEALKGRRILIAHGVDDTVVPFRSGKALSEMLREHGVAHEFFPYRGEHRITQDVREAVHGWLRGEAVPEELKAEEK